MKSEKLIVGALGVVLLGCRPTLPPAAVPPTVVQAPAPVPTKLATAPAPVIALVEPYLVESAALRFPTPPSLHGRIMPDMRDIPILPSPPTQTVPIEPSLPAPAAPSPRTATPAPKRSSAVSPAVVKLFEDERARSVADAGRRLAAAAARATQTAAEAKRQWGFVKDGFVAQKQAENADAAAKDAAAEQADAQKSLDEAQSRQRSALRDIEAALRVVTWTHSPLPSGGEGSRNLGESAAHGSYTRGMELAQLTVPAKSYQPVPQTYRLSILGAGPVTISVQNGLLARRLDPAPGEAGAWLVHCPDPAKLRVGVGTRPATLVVRALPSAEVSPKV